jgi:ABC-2 type transport system permease protein
MPYSKIQYIASTLLTIIIMGLASAVLILIAGLPILIPGNVTFDITSTLYLTFALIMGSIFFGSIAIIISTRLRSNEGFTVIINTVFLFFAFASSTFYPPHGLPAPMQYAFYSNPLTYIADIIREGMFSAVDTLTNIKILVLGAISGIAFLIATLSMYKMRI